MGSCMVIYFHLFFMFINRDVDGKTGLMTAIQQEGILSLNQSIHKHLTSYYAYLFLIHFDD